MSPELDVRQWFRSAGLALLAGLILAILLMASGSSHAQSGPGLLPNFAAAGDNQIRLLAGAFDPLAGRLPRGAGLAPVQASRLPAGQPQYWLVQAHDKQFDAVTAVVKASGATLAGVVPDNSYMVRATPAQATRIAAGKGVRWVGYYQPAWRLPVAAGGRDGILELAGTQIYRVRVFRAEPDPAVVARALAGIKGVTIVDDGGYVLDVEATAAQLPAMAAIPAVEWIGVRPAIELHNANARWVNDTGIRDVYAATAPGRLTGAGQTAAVADTGINYTYDLNGRAHVAFRDCDPDGRNCKEAIYTQATPGNATANLLNVVNHGTDHRKVVAYFDLGSTGPNMFDTSSHGSHTGGSVTGDQGNNGVWDGHDGIAPGAMHVHQNIGTVSGGLRLPTDDYQLWRQAYRPRNPGSVPTSSPATGNVADYANYIPTEDARTHNNSYGLIAPVIDEGSAVALDRFVWDHEDMLIVVSAGNGGPGLFSIGSPSVAKNMLSSAASANGRQPMASIDSIASFSSHGPTADGRYGPDLATPGQIVVSVKGGTEDGYHVAQGTSMSGPILTGLATLTRQYFFDGYGPAGGSGFAGGAPDPARAHNPSAALVKATLINGAERMRGWYTGDDGNVRALDGQWPSAGQGFGLVNLANSLYFTDDPTNNWYHDVWRADADAFGVSGLLPVVREYRLQVTAGAPLDVTLAWTDAPDLAPAGSPALVNNLDLEVVGPSGTIYLGNNMNSRLTPGVAVAETLAGPGVADSVNVAERVRIAAPSDGVYTIRVIGQRVLQGQQGFALAASGRIAPVGQTFTPGPGLQVDVPGNPAINKVVVTPISADTAVITFDTSEPTTATATADDGINAPVTYIDSYNVGSGGFHGLNHGNVETSAAYGDRPVLGARHEILLTGLAPGQQYAITLAATDLAGNVATASTSLDSPATVYQPDAPDIAQLVQGGTGGWRTGTQLYAGRNGGDELLGAFMFRIPETAVDPNAITGAAVVMTSAHDWVVRYTQDPLLTVDLLEESVETLWGTQTYDLIANAAADARAYPETAHLRGAGYSYAFTFTCTDLAALQASLSTVQDGERRAAFRYRSTDIPGTGLFAMDFGFNRRSNGPALRPTLVLFTGDDNPSGAPCDPHTPAPTISRVGIHDGVQPDTVTVSWETDVAADSLVLFREQGTTDWIQVGTPARTRVHHVAVQGLDRSKAYEFAVRSAACNGATTTDSNGGAGYNFFYPPSNSFVAYLTGEAGDQANKVAGNPTATFNTTPPAGDVPITQHGTPGANANTPENSLAVFWTGDLAEPIPAGTQVAFDWYFTSRFGNVFVTTAELTIFAGDPLVRIHQERIDLDVFLAATPNYNSHRITLQGAAADQLSIQLTTPFVNNDFTAYYGATSTPSSFNIPDPNAPDLPLTGPVPPPSAGASGLVVPPTRLGPASAADIAAGTGYCAIPTPNNPPAAQDDAATVARGGAVTIDVLANDSDPDGDALTVTGFSQPAHGTVTDNGDGTLTYSHDGSATSADAFTYTIGDGRGGTDSATVTITIVDQPPPDGTKVTGGGWLASVEGRKINFGFNAKETAGGPSGELQLNDKAAGVKIHLSDVTALGAVGAGCGNISAGPNAAEFQGTGSYNGQAGASFRVCVEDNGEPGQNSDRFYLECLAGCSYDTGSRAADDRLGGGNIQVHTGNQGGNAGAGEGQPAASTLILDPLLQTEGVAGVLQTFTVRAYDAAQAPLADAAITLTGTAADGSLLTLTGVTDLTGTAVFTTINLTQTTEYIASAGAVQSNGIELTAIFNSE